MADRYVLEHELGRGGMATVYLARDRRHSRAVAFKVLNPEVAARIGPERFLREIRTTARLQHSSILPLFDSGDTAGHLWYVMPYVDGESLRQRLDREKQLPLAEAIHIALDVLAALSYAHECGIVHRDIKPENILLVRESASAPVHPFVADFGIARALDAAGGERLTETGLALGTPTYMSPEQAAGDGRLDGRSDVYALGCVLYEMLAGTPPFTGPTAQAIMARHAVDEVPRLRTVRRQVPAAVEEAIERALAKVPADRYGTAGEFAAALLGVATSQAPRWWGRSRGHLAFLLGGTIALGTAAASTALWRKAHTTSVLPAASTIAVLPFGSPSGDTALVRLGRDLAATLSATLDGVGGIKTADRLSVATATVGRLDVSASDAAAVARRLGARSMVRGTVVHDGDAVRMDLGVFDVNGLAPLTQGITISGDADSLGTLTNSAAWAILRQVWQLGQPPSPSLAAVTTSSVPALRAFLEGERLVEQDRWEDAGLAFRSAIAADTTFWLARFRHQQTRYWLHEDIDLPVMDELERHRNVFPEPDQLLLDAWSQEHRDSPPAQLELYRELTRRFPDYWPGWLALGDFLFHTGPFLGHDWRTAQSALRRAATLNSRHMSLWNHLFINSIGKDTLESGLALRNILELIPRGPPGNEAEQAHIGRVHRLGQQLARAGGVMDPVASTLMDSVASRLVMRNTRNWPHSWLFLVWGFPAAQRELSRRVLQRAPDPELKVEHLRGIAWSWAAEGRWDSALTAIHQSVELLSDPVAQDSPTPMEEYGLAVLGAWLGTIDEGDARSRRTAAAGMISTASNRGRRADLLGTLAWLDGLLAFARHDRDALASARAEGRSSGHPQARLIDRSLGAFDLALAGDRVGAGRRLAALEWQCTEDERLCRVDIPNVAVQRLAAATWLLEAGDTSQAARLLVWQEAGVPGWNWSFTLATTPLAHLLLARIDFAQGNIASAKTHYEQFLRRYDSPMPAQQQLVDEARRAIARPRVRE